MLSRFHRLLRDLFSIDARCLALFRMALALLILTDLLLRSHFIVECYTDDGFLPRDLVAAPACYFSLQMLDGSYAFQLAHFVVAAIGAVMLLMGYRTRMATVICWLLTISLHARNEFVLDAGDDLLRSMLFWSLFLPLGARYSIDARGRLLQHPRIVLSLATAALLLQFALVYFTAGWFKSDAAWRDGTAIVYALGQTQWILPAGEFLRQYPDLLTWLTPCVVWFEIIAPLCLFIPWETRRIRMVVIPAFWLFQFGLGVTIWLHIFPLIAAAATIPFLSSVIWPISPGNASPANGLASTSPSAAPKRGRALWSTALAFLAVSTILLQAANFGKSLLPTQERIVSLIGWNVIWSMYSNLPRYTNEFSTEATLRDGSTIDLVNSDISTGDRLRVQQFHKSYRIRYFLQTASLASPDVPTRYLTNLILRWNQSQPPDRHVVRARILGTTRKIGTPDPAETSTLLDLGLSPLAPEQG